MRTPSLHRRVARSTVLLVGAVLIAADILLYVALAARLDSTLDEVIDARAAVARELAADLDPEALVVRLAAAGIPARVVDPDGREHRSSPVTVRAGELPPADPDLPPEPRVSQLVPVADGTTITVFASRAGIQQTLRGLLLVQALVTATGVAAAALLSRRATALALEPLDEMIDTARRIEAGATEERLSPDQPETELGGLATAFDRMVDALDAALQDTRAAEQRTRRFLDDAAHQLRTPLTGIQGSAEAVLREAAPERRERLLANLVRETRRMSRLVESLLRLARLDAAEGPADPRSRGLGDLVRDEVERAQALAPGLTVHLDTAPDDEEAVGLATVPAELTESLGNLLDNARRHAAARIDVRLAGGDDGLLHVHVRDDGPGVPEDEREAVFDRFVSLDGRGGSGLGLSIARTLARAAGGDLVHDGEGFLLTVPPATSRDEPGASPGSR